MKNKADMYARQGLTTDGDVRADIKMAVNKNKRPSVGVAHQRNKFYSTNAWVLTRNSYIKAHPLCEVCKAEGLLVPARLIHHLHPLSMGGEQLCQDNLMSICGETHHSLLHKIIDDNKEIELWTREIVLKKLGEM